MIRLGNLPRIPIQKEAFFLDDLHDMYIYNLKVAS